MATVYEVWRYCDYDKSNDVYKRQELLYTSGNVKVAKFAMAMFELGRMSALREMTPKINSTVDTNGGLAKLGIEFIDRKGRPEYWCIVEKEVKK